MKYLLVILLFASCKPNSEYSEGEPLYRMGNSGFDVTARDTAAFKKFLNGDTDTFEFSLTGLKVYRTTP